MSPATLNWRHLLPTAFKLLLYDRYEIFIIVYVNNTDAFGGI